ncbi:cbb3-type cytochrome c oxidase subunit I [Gemmatimonas sp.]|uniref:cbb3-type cytochrome c oxidase subunit I n=1 Tax=Gemmatimonas sp. TaxID=1962908 RepID=UPI00286C293E|nr:cbb3-type cytochrome c oxidase subunit I [Gemmatimonas sp.]
MRAFLRSSVCWLAAGVSLGTAMAVHPAWAIYRPAHLHMNLLGFVSMMIFGVGYHIIPRLAGKPLHSRRLGMIHLWIGNVGLLLFAPGLMLQTAAHAAGPWLIGVGATLSATGAYCFTWQVWRTLQEVAVTPTRAPEVPASAPRARRPLRVLDEHTPVTEG